MSWVLVIGLGLAAFAVMAFALRLPRGAWTSALAALAFGLSGYALQGSPDLAGAPKSAAAADDAAGATLVDLRRAVLPDRFESHSGRLITADALARRGRPEDAATILRGAIRETPGDAEVWLALANALVAATDGRLTPASQYAYRRAEELEPESPGVPFFVGVAQLQANRLMEVRGLWQEAAQRTEEGSDERAEIDAHRERLQAVMRQILAAQGLTPPGE